MSTPINIKTCVVEYLEASGAVSITIIERDGVCANRSAAISQSTKKDIGKR